MLKTIKKILRPFFSENMILWTHKVRAIFAAIYYGFPAGNLKIIGVTGTNGKTTTCHLIASILEEAGFKVGLMSTINFKIGSEVFANESKMTTLNPFFVQKMLRKMVQARCQYAIIETTSHAIKQYRVWGVRYYAAVLTNISHDHLDYHKTYEDYKNTKLKLFARHPQISIINADDDAAEDFLRQISQKSYSYGIDNKADIIARKILFEPNNTLFTMVTPAGQTAVNLSLPGKFNVYNALAAAGIGLGVDLDLPVIKSGLEKITGIPGRMEKVEMSQDFTVIVDFAHTPDGLQKVFETIKPISKGKIIHVGGATGDRDKTKRPILGALAGKYADIAIVTDEDPASEDPKEIIEQVAAGVPRGADKDNPKILNKNFFIIQNRKSAIRKAISLAKRGDVVLITGKGAETKMIVGPDQFIPWSDREVVEEILGKKQ